MPEELIIIILLVVVVILFLVLIFLKKARLNKSPVSTKETKRPVFKTQKVEPQKMKKPTLVKKAVTPIPSEGQEENSKYHINDTDKLLDCFHKMIADLEAEPSTLKLAKGRYRALQEQCNYLQSEVSTIIGQALAPKHTEMFQPRLRYYVADAIASQIQLAYNSTQMDRADEWTYLYEKLTQLLGVHVTVVIPFISSQGKYEPSFKIEGFSGRGGDRGIGFNQGLWADKEAFVEFMKIQHKSYVSPFLDQGLKVTRDPDRENMEKLDALMKGADISSLPVNSEVVIYFAGNSHRGSGDWLIYDDDGHSDLITLEMVMTWWTSKKQSKSNNLTIIADCSFSGHWVERLKSEEKYHKYAVCIQAACLSGEMAYESTLVPLLIEKEPKIIGQTPQFFRTSTHLSKINFADFNDWILDLPRNLFRKVLNKLVKPNEEKRQAGEKVISRLRSERLNTAETTIVTLEKNDPLYQQYPIVVKQKTPDEYRGVGFTNIAVKTGEEVNAQLFIQYKPPFNLRSRVIRQALRWSLRRQVPCWMICAKPGEQDKKSTITHNPIFSNVRQVAMI